MEAARPRAATCDAARARRLQNPLGGGTPQPKSDPLGERALAKFHKDFSRGIATSNV